MARRIGILGLVVLLVMVSATGCKKLPAHVTGTLAANQAISYVVGPEPETLDPHLMSGIPEFNTVSQIFEGLTRVDAKNNPYAGVAESWTVSADALTYTFTLRQNSKWTNGDKVTAKDFEWSWKRALDPRTASPYAYQLYYIKGGLALNTLAPDAQGNYDAARVKQLSDALGVKCEGDYKIIVTLEAPTSFFLSLCGFPTLYPVHRATVERLGDKWANEAANFVTNGPFKMTKWVHNSVIEMEKNPDYWNAKIVVLKKLTLPLVDAANTELTMWESGQIDMGNNVPVQEVDRLKAAGKLTVLPYLGTYYYSFNVTKKPFDDARVRKAFAYAINRKDLVEKITKAGQLPATAFVCPGIKDADGKTDFRTVGGNLFKDNDLVAARALLAEAGYTDMTKFPVVELLYNESVNHRTIAEAIQVMWSEGLGLPLDRVKLRVEEWKVYLPTRYDTHDFKVARAGWIGDYADPMTFLDMFVTGGGNNDVLYANPQYDELIATAKGTGNQTARMTAMHDAEKILMDDMAISPIYFYVSVWVIKPWVKGVAINTLGLVDFVQAWVEKH